MSCLMPFQSYSASYMRINAKNGKVHSLKTSPKFKIAFKEKSQYPLEGAVPDMLNNEYTIVFENEPNYDKLSKIRLEDLCVSTSRAVHRKGIKSLIDTVLLFICYLVINLRLGSAINQDNPVLD